MASYKPKFCLKQKSSSFIQQQILVQANFTAKTAVHKIGNAFMVTFLAAVTNPRTKDQKSSKSQDVLMK